LRDQSLVVISANIRDRRGYYGRFSIERYWTLRRRDPDPEAASQRCSSVPEI
jgi:hypothetical protein